MSTPRKLVETVFESVSVDDIATVSTGEKRWITRLKELAKDFPEYVHIVSRNRDGTVCYHIPKDWIRIKPPRRCYIYEEDEEEQETEEEGGETS